MNGTCEAAVRPSHSEPGYFSSAEHLLGIVQHIMAQGHDVRATLPGVGAVAVFPAQAACCASVPDMRAFCRAPAARFETTPLGAREAAALRSQGPLRNVSELLWEAAFHASDGRIVEAGGRRAQLLDVVRFRHWPNLSRLPLTPNTMRICALLTRQPSSLFLIPRKLGITQEEVFQVYSAAHCSGVAELVSDGDAFEPVGGGAAAAGRYDLLHSLRARIARL